MVNFPCFKTFFILMFKDTFLQQILFWFYFELYLEFSTEFHYLQLIKIIRYMIPCKYNLGIKF
jgi:hypothetical protein